MKLDYRSALGIPAGKTFYLHGTGLPIGELVALTDSPQLYVCTEVGINAWGHDVSTLQPFDPEPLSDERLWEWLAS